MNLTRDMLIIKTHLSIFESAMESGEFKVARMHAEAIVAAGQAFESMASRAEAGLPAVDAPGNVHVSRTAIK